MRPPPPVNKTTLQQPKGPHSPVLLNAHRSQSLGYRPLRRLASPLVAPALFAMATHAGARQNGASCFKVQSKLHFVLHWQYRPNLRLPRRKSRILSQSVTAPIALTPLASRAVLCFRPTRVLEIRMNHRLIRHTGHHPNGKNQNPRCPTTEGASLRL